jgi:UDP-glucose 4-epimerase
MVNVAERKMADAVGKVLVTGGAGFIGSHLVDSLMDRGYSVRVLDDLSNGSLKNLERWLADPRFEFVQGDLKSLDVAKRGVEDVETVFHLAANPDIRLGESDPSVHFGENLVVTFNVLEAMRKSETAKSVVFSSTSTVYGEAVVLPTPEDYGPLLPISIYGASKLGCEALIASYCHTFDFKGALLRFANIVGSRSNHGVVIDFANKLKRDSSELEILGDGTQEKSYLHVKDLVGAFFVVLNDLGKSGFVEAYNVGSLDRVTVLRIAEIVCEEMGIGKPRFKFNKSVEGGRGCRGDVKVMQLSVEKLTSLGWKPTIDSEDAVRLSCKEFLESF